MAFTKNKLKKVDRQLDALQKEVSLKSDILIATRQMHNLLRNADLSDEWKEVVFESLENFLDCYQELEHSDEE